MEELYKNPHFSELKAVLEDNFPEKAKFIKSVEIRLAELKEEHKDDNPVLKEECFEYILPAIAVYEAMKKYMADPLTTFRKMWLSGAYKGASFLRDKAKEDGFLEIFIKNMTPKNCDAGAFLFDIVRQKKTETEYHVLRCPYVDLCNYYGCPEIVTVFCDSDDVSFGNISDNLKWERKKTIGRGDNLCDFKLTIL